MNNQHLFKPEKIRRTSEWSDVSFLKGWLTTWKPICFGEPLGNPLGDDPNRIPGTTSLYKYTETSHKVGPIVINGGTWAPYEWPKINGFSWGKSTYNWEGPAHLALIALILWEYGICISQNYKSRSTFPMPETSGFLIAKWSAKRWKVAAVFCLQTAPEIGIRFTWVGHWDGWRWFLEDHPS